MGTLSVLLTRMKRKQEIRNMTLFAMFLAIELVLMLTPLGFIRTGFLNITLMHIPVIAAGILMGPNYGAALGLVFGLLSIWNSTVNPSATAFVFSPFITIGGISGNWTSLIIALVPRILLGYLAGWFFKFFSNLFTKRFTAAFVTAVLATFLHSVMVLGLIGLLWGAQYAQVIGQSPDGLFGYLAVIIFTNGLGEMLAAGLVCGALAKAIKPLAPPPPPKPF